MKHRIGDILEFAFWVTGEETEEEIHAMAEQADKRMSDVMRDDNIMLAKCGVVELKMGDERLPELPNHIHGPDVRCLIFEARVLLDLPAPSKSRFADELEKDDFRRLSVINQTAYSRLFPNAPPLTHGQQKTIINGIGEEAVLDVLRGYVTDTTEYIQ